MLKHDSSLLRTQINKHIGIKLKQKEEKKERKKVKNEKEQ